ncbi:uncharacterized protein LOC133119300 [Conger conger]|uniref:uncharacterized protein LOC133119300 n=1 Tax=Conger conger TaxID=82655 RepID=UPI002A5A2D74|nr:uncharacterized protein LOC133119300 [Conger conger]
MKDREVGRSRQKSAEVGRSRQKSAEVGRSRQKSAEVGRSRQKSAEVGRSRQKSGRVFLLKSAILGSCPEALKTFRTEEVFPCENGTEYLHQKESFIITLGYSRRFPLRQESGAASALLVAWSRRSLAAHDPPHRVTLYQLEPSGLVPLCNDTAHAPRYLFTGLQGCGSYVACVERARGPSLLCLGTLTDPDVPANFRVTAWDSSSLTVGWDYPPSDRLASFLVTVFHTNGSGHVLEERRYRQEPDRRGFTVGPLSPCSRVRLGLQAECRGPGPAHPSTMALSDGNSGEPVVQQGRLQGPPLSLKGLRPGALYDLEVVPECPGGAEQGATAVLQFTTEEVPGDAPRNSPGAQSSGTTSERSAGPTTERLGLQVRLADHRMFLVVPWTIPSPLKDPAAESRVLLEGVIKHQLQSLLRKSWPRAEVQLISFEDYEKKTKTKIAFESFDVSSQNGVVSLLPKEQLQYFTSLNHPNITVTEEVLYWQDPDECVDSALNECGSHSLCINTLDSFTCVCQPGYYDLSPFLTPACHETGMFSRCQTGDVSGAVSKPFLLRHFGGNVTTVLNDGRCPLQETDKLYYYRMTSAPSLCGGETLLAVKATHVSLRNTMTVTLSSGSSITRRDLKVLWTCAYPLLHTSTAHTQPGLAWFSSHSVVQASSSRLLQLSMGLYSDASYASSHAYAGPVELPLSARLHIQVTLHSQDSLAFQMSLELEACWATETTDPLEERRAFYLKEGMAGLRGEGFRFRCSPCLTTPTSTSTASPAYAARTRTAPRTAAKAER